MLAGELVSIELDITQNGESILDENRQFEVQVGERFDVEILYDDLREDGNGAARFLASVIGSFPEAYLPAVYEEQVVTLTGDFSGTAGGGRIDLSAEGSR